MEEGPEILYHKMIHCHFMSKYIFQCKCQRIKNIHIGSNNYLLLWCTLYTDITEHVKNVNFGL